MVQSNTVKDAIITVDKGIEVSSGVNMTVVIIASAAVIVALAAVAFVLTKKKEKVNA